jgi:3-oxoisoapionate kinase
MTRLLSFYGDDFTGSTDVMEALASHGVNTVLFTRIPTAEEFAPFADYSAIGLAGTSRSQTPAWMDENLPAIFAWLKSLDAQFCHYKVCSTFDSSPRVGSIGRATEIGLKIFQQKSVTLIVGAPQLKRYTFAGHLFAAYQGQTYRIDRHPVMSNHPVTPMHESDLRIHLAEQTLQSVDLVDVHDLETQRQAGEYLKKLPAPSSPFIVGSSGVEYALMNAMKDANEIAGRAIFADMIAVQQIIAVSGSVSHTTERQIKFALNNGYTGIEANPLALAQPNNQGEYSRLLTVAMAALANKQSPLVYTALGGATDLSQHIDSIPNGRHRLGQALGRIARECVEQYKLKRLIIAGGDTSSHALTELDIFALTTRFPLKETPGSPLCVAHSQNPVFNGVEIAMKGGQVGGDDYFVKLRDGNFIKNTTA